MYLHNLDPVAIEIFSLKIYWYSLSYFFGFLLSIYYSKFLIRKNNLVITEKNIDDFLSWAVLGVVFGGRLGYVFFYNINFYSNNILEIFKIWNGGMSFHGGMLGLIISTYLFSIHKKISFFELSNIISACAPIGLFLGRIANFINGELYGKPTNSKWGVIFEKENMIPRHPSQLYEAFFEGLIIFIIIFLIYKNKMYQKYFPCFIFLIFYGLFRFIIEFLREPDSHIGYVFGLFSTGQLLSIPMIIIGIVLLIKSKSG